MVLHNEDGKRRVLWQKVQYYLQILVSLTYPGLN